MAFNYNHWEYQMEEHYSEYPVESDPRAYAMMGSYEDIVGQTQQILGGNSNPIGSVGEYGDRWGSTHAHNFFPAYTPPVPPQYTWTPQPQPPQPISPLEQAILDLSKQVGNFVKEKRGVSVQAKQEIDTMESSLYREWGEFQDETEENYDITQQAVSRLTEEPILHKEEPSTVEGQGDQEIYMLENPLDLNLDGLRMDPEQKWNNLQDSSEGHIVQQQCPPEEKCQSGSILGKQVQLQEEMKEGLEELQESMAFGAVIDAWEMDSPILDKECSGMRKIEEPQKPTAQNTLAPLLTAPSKPQKCPLPACVQPSPATKPTVPSHCPAYTLPVHTVPIPAAHPKSKPPAPTTKSIPSSPAMQKLKRLVASVRDNATTSKTMAATYTAWHSGWFECRFGLGAPEPGFSKLHQLLQHH